MKLCDIYEEYLKGKKIRHKTWEKDKYFQMDRNIFLLNSFIKVSDALSEDWELFEEEKNPLDTITEESAAWGCLIVKFNNFMVEANERIEKLERENQFLKAEWTKIKTLDDLWARIEKLENFKKEILRIEPVETLAICIHGIPAKLGCDYCVK